ncbi:MAG TPA: hypothetical protein VI934_04095, partial [Candidatus Nanoarchaeia archaeon]|nr:hypothetical protein [Candidatus Nanoarchaeia archaeon]
MLAGVDLWVVAAIAEEEASGTSPMKAGLNGNKTLSTPGGFWPEVKGTDGRLGYTFSGVTEADQTMNFYGQLRRAMTDYSAGALTNNTWEVMLEFLTNFSAVRMVRQYGEVWFGKTQSKSLEGIFV